MKSIRWSLMAACVSLLTACGGGGGGGDDDKKPEPEVKLSASYAVILSESTRIAYGSQLDIVDPSSGKLLRSVSVDGYDAWRTTLRRSQSSDGRTETFQHEVGLYYVDGRKVYALDLSRGASTEPRQVSALTDACNILWHLDSDLSGADSWLAIVTAGPDANCQTSADNAFALVHSSTTASTPANGGSFHLDAVLTSGRDASGRLQRVILFDQNAGKFVELRLDMGLAEQDVTNGGGIRANADIRWLGRLPGFQNREIVQVDGTLRMLSWNDTNTTLSGNLFAGAVPYAPLVGADASHLYMVVEHLQQVLVAIDGTGVVSQIATLQANKGAAAQLMVSSDAVWVVQQIHTSPTAPSTLTKFNKTSGASQEVDHYAVPAGLPLDMSLRLIGVNGTRLVYAKPSDTDDDDPIALHVIDGASSSPRLLAPRVFGIGAHVVPTALAGQFRDTSHLFWCDIGTPSAPLDCTAKRFKSYNLATGNVTLLGQNLAGTDASAVLEYADLGNSHGLNSLISTVRREYAPDHMSMTVTTNLWQFRPDDAGSLTFIAYASGGTSTSSGGSGNSGTITSSIVTPAPSP